MTSATAMPASSHGVRSTVRSGNEEQPDGEPDDQEPGRPFVEEAEADQRADHEPQPRVTAVEDADDEQRDAAPRRAPRV